MAKMKPQNASFALKWLLEAATMSHWGSFEWGICFIGTCLAQAVTGHPHHSPTLLEFLKIDSNPWPSNEARPWLMCHVKPQNASFASKWWLEAATMSNWCSFEWGMCYIGTFFAQAVTGHPHHSPTLLEFLKIDSKPWPSNESRHWLMAQVKP